VVFHKFRFNNDLVIRRNSIANNRNRKTTITSHSYIARPGTLVASQEAVIGEMEKKHGTEQDFLLDLVGDIEKDQGAMEKVSKLPSDERNEKLSVMAIQRKKLKEKAKAFIDSQPPENEMNEVCYCFVYLCLFSSILLQGILESN